MKFIITLIIWLFLVGQARQTVYLCNSKDAYTYHLRKDCPRLKECSKLITTSLDSAQRVYGYLPCPICTDTSK